MSARRVTIAISFSIIELNEITVHRYCFVFGAPGTGPCFEERGNVQERNLEDRDVEDGHCGGQRVAPESRVVERQSSGPFQSAVHNYEGRFRGGSASRLGAVGRGPVLQSC